MDPTYNTEEINKNPVWKKAFELSEQKNDNAPIGWSLYIPEAEKALEGACSLCGETESELNDVNLDEVPCKICDGCHQNLHDTCEADS